MNIKQKLICANNPESKTFLYALAGMFVIGVNFMKPVINLTLAGFLAITLTGVGLYYASASLVQARLYWNQFRFVDKFFKALGFLFMIILFLCDGRLIFGIFFRDR
jgi:hypothetical protein